MPYEIRATSNTPQLVIFLIDVSASMKTRHGHITRMELAEAALTLALQEMIDMSIKGARISPRYSLALATYSDTVNDAFGGIRSIEEVVQLIDRQGREIKFTPSGGTNTSAAFSYAENLLLSKLPSIQGHPAPIVIHLTDGLYDGSDPEPIVRRIMSMKVNDGNILVVNILLSDKILEGTNDEKNFTGITPSTSLDSDLALKLRRMSSEFPESYLRNIYELSGIHLSNGSLMFIPALHHGLIKFAFQIALVTSFGIHISADLDTGVGKMQKDNNYDGTSFVQSNDKFDVFISHASEDKAIVAKPLAQELMARGLKVWLDEYELTVGDTLRREIDRGLTQSRFGVVILSPSFFSKEWPQRELDSLVARDDGKEKVILPIWHNISQKEVVRYSPLLASKLAVSTDKGIAYVAQEVIRAIQRAQKK